MLSDLVATDQKWRDSLDTPSVVIDLDVVEGNLLRGAEFTKSSGLSFRPHIKTHKIPQLAKAQLELGAVGITAQKISEAEVMVKAGITDVLISFNIVGSRKLDRLARLFERADIRTVADNVQVVLGLAKHFQNSDRQLGVLVEIDGQMDRCGATSADEAMDVVQAITASAGLRFDGFMVYPAPKRWVEALEFLEECKERCTGVGIEVSILSSGGTPDMLNLVASSDLTEYRAGSYIYNDRSLVELGSATVEDCALSILATVVSTPTKCRAIIDAGSKTLSSDLFGMAGFGLVKGHPKARVFALSEEHGHLDFPAGYRPDIGEKVEIIPNHCCVISNLVDSVFFVRGAQLVSKQPVAARGMTA